IAPRQEDVIRRVLAHHAEQTRRAKEREPVTLASGYAKETLDVLFGRGIR
ncbi:MAG: integrase, partial [Acidobacteria bacterium]|nr:integrase [Acidobacteriota bacterium]